MKPSLEVAANGHLTLCLNDSANMRWKILSHKLVSVHGFKISGDSVFSSSEKIYPSFLSDKCLLEAGWDNWSGNYLLSTSFEGDEFMRLLFAEIVSL